MDERLDPSYLTWRDVDPATHPFDPATAAGTIAGIAATVPSPPIGRWDDPGMAAWMNGPARQWSDAMAAAMLDRYGRWALGWRWALGAGQIGGGPVQSWCCPGHSITNRDETLAKVAAGLCEWRDWLEELADRFSRGGAVDLITRVVEKTDAADTWPVHCQQVLEWFLTSRGVPADAASKAVEVAVGARFEDWRAPERSVLETVASRIVETP